MPSQFVRMRHGGHGGEADISALAVRQHEALGWQIVPPEPPPAPKKRRGPKTTPSESPVGDEKQE